MEVEKGTSKGGFLNLFDWGVKSRKKLFSDSCSSELPVGLEEGKDNVEKLGTSPLCLIEVNENEASSSNKGSNDFNCASSITSDEKNGARAPGVVARLMGLDSLPTSSVCEPCFTPFIDSFSFKDSRYDGIYTNFRRENHIVNYNIMHSKVNGFSRNPVKSEPQKVQRRPIERFQTEMLPRKSAKPIPVTHIKLLSPIKSPAFIPTKSKAYTMEVAAKMIEPSPQTTAKSKRTSCVSSSVPLRIRDLKEKMEAAQKASRTQKPKETDPFRHTKGQLHHKNSSIDNRSENASLFKASTDRDKCGSDSLKNNRRSMSIAVQAKVNVQRKEGPISSSTRRSMGQKEPNEIKCNQLLKSQSNTQISGQKRTSISRTSGVLQQNNHKQNIIPHKEKITSKASFFNQQSRKSLSVADSSALNKTVNKVVLNSGFRSRKIALVSTVAEMELSPSRTKNSPRKKQSVDEDIYFEERVSDNNVLIHKDGRSIQCNTVVDGHINWGSDKRKDGTDVVSFTFSSPVKRSISGSLSSSQSMENNGSYGVDSHGQNDPTDSKLTSQELNLIDADSLSILLEQKLRELTYKIESPQCNMVETGPGSAFSLQNSIQNLNILSTTSVTTDKGSEVDFHKDGSGGIDDSDGSSIDDLVLKVSQKWQNEHSSHRKKSGAREELDCLYPIQLSSLEPFFSNGSCYSSDSRINNGRNHYFLAEPHEEVNSILEKEFQPAEYETELSDLASSTFTVDMGRKHTSQTSLTEFMRSNNWELQYLRDILGNSEFMVENFVLGQACQVITPNLFDELETIGSWGERNGEEYSKFERKVLFDCVREYLDSRCGQLSVGSCKTWAKWASLFQRQGWLVDELYKDISGLRSMEDLMVDELVDKDMSTELGRWLDFRIEAFEEGVEIEKGILLSLVDELVTDISANHFDDGLA